jgi:hypothetical protein
VSSFAERVVVPRSGAVKSREDAPLDVGLPPTGRTARFDPLALAEANQRILGSNYGSVDPQRDIPRLIDLYMEASSISTRSSPAAGRSTRRPKRSTTWPPAGRCARC